MGPRRRHFQGGPISRPAYTFFRRRTSLSLTLVCPINCRVVVPRCPQVRMAEKTMRRTASSICRRGDEYHIVAAELQVRAAERATRGPTSAPQGATRHGHESDTLIVHQRFASISLADNHPRKATGHIAELLRSALENRPTCEHGQRRLLGWFPNHRIAADNCQGKVPRSYRRRGVERTDHTNHSQRTPVSITLWPGRSDAI